jgi:phosphoribosyl 1,2-cyclic phosphodiesterase
MPRAPAQPELTALRFRVLGSGSGGNATLVEAGGTRVLLDAGLGPRTLAERLESVGVDPTSLAAVVLSHEHGDHARGAAAFSRRFEVPVACTAGTRRAAGLDEVATTRLLRPGAPFDLGALSISSVALPHDAAEPVGFVVSTGSARLGHATDLGHVSRGVVAAFRHCDALLLESNYDPAMLRGGPYPWSLKERILSPVGHVSNADVARYLATGLGPDCRTVVLAHLSQTNNHPELARGTAEESLRRSRRSGVRVELSGPEGTGWIDVTPVRTRRPPEHTAQLRLF